jgi:hypothetical protein
MLRMPLRDYFPASSWVVRAVTGRIPRRVYAAMVLVLLVASTAARVHSFVLTRKMQAVISGLSNLNIDETTEDEALREVPYLIRSKWDQHEGRNAEVGDVESGIERIYYVTISNQPDWMRFEVFAWRYSSVESSKDGHQKSWIFTAADLLGYRYIGFGAWVGVFNGKVSSIRYEIADELSMPATFGELVSVKSFHSRWAPYQHWFEVRSTEDESPEFIAGGNERHLAVSFAPQASPVLRSHIFRVNLSCFWSLLGCRHPRQIAPLLWQDKKTIEDATLARLKSDDPCPDRIIAGRMRYLPDADVVLLESTGFKTESINEEGLRVDETRTNYKLLEVLRGRSSMSWDSVKGSPTVPYPGDYQRTLPNRGLQWAKAGERVLAFSNLYCDSCRMVPATLSALSAVRGATLAPRRAEDELALTGLQ